MRVVVDGGWRMVAVASSLAEWLDAEEARDVNGWTAEGDEE